MSPSVADGALLCVAHPMFDFGEGLLDRIEIGRVRRQEPEPCACGFDDPAKGGRFVATEIVHDDDVASLQGRHELLLDIGAEALAVDRPIEDARRGEAVAAQRAQKGQSAPMTMWSKAAQPFALWSPAAHRRHVGLDPSLIDEDELGGIEAILPGPPSRPPARDICTSLLKGEQRFF